MMTPGAVAGFRRLFRLRDVLGYDKPDAMFDSLVEVARWAVAERRNPDPTNDAILSTAVDRTALQMGLLLHLATIDRAFFGLSKRMAARTIAGTNYPPARLYLEMAAALLIAGEGPKSRQPVLARNVALVLAIAVGTEAGWNPTENSGKNELGQSGCGRAAQALGVEYAAVEKVWKLRERNLLSADFSTDQVSDFFKAICPMT